MIPGWLINILTFPGVVVHEMAHAQFCRLFGVRVHQVCYFRLGRRAGYVIHDMPTTATQHILIGIGPFIFNTLLGMIAAVPFAMPDLRWTAVGVFSLWLGMSIAMHAFPSTGDAASIWRGLWSPGISIFGRLISIPLVLLIYLGALGSVFWLDLIYGAAVAIWLPRILIDYVKHLAG